MDSAFDDNARDAAKEAYLETSTALFTLTLETPISESQREEIRLLAEAAWESGDGLVVVIEVRLKKLVELATLSWATSIIGGPPKDFFALTKIFVTDKSQVAGTES